MKADKHTNNVVHIGSYNFGRRHPAQKPTDFSTNFQEELKVLGILPEHREAFLSALWTIMVAFVDLGYGIHPTQRGPLPGSLDAEILAAVDDFAKNAA
jgi:hypothetical protein